MSEVTETGIRSQVELEKEIERLEIQVANSLAEQDRLARELDIARQNLAELTERVRVAEGYEMKYRRLADELVERLRVAQRAPGAGDNSAV